MILQSLSISNSQFVIIGLCILAVIVFVVVVMAMLLNKNKNIEPEESDVLLGVEWQKKLMPLRLQACERLLLLLERIEVGNLVKRFDASNLTSPEHQYQLISAVRQEYDHNVSQQLYISDETWSLVQSSIEQLISVINQLGSNLPTNASGQDLNKSLLNYFLSQKEDVRTTAMKKIKRELWTAW